MMISKRTTALLVGTLLTILFVQPTLAAPGTTGNCAGTDAGAVKDESGPFSLNGYYSAAYFKAGTQCYGPFSENTVVSIDGIDCFWVEVSDSTIKVTKVGPGQMCKDVSHLEGVRGTEPVVTPEPTATPVPTPVPTPPPFPEIG
jgi:hypothetical protein